MDSGKECLGSAKAALLEKRIEDLEISQQKESEFREAYYKEQKDRIRRDAILDGKFDVIDDKLNRLLAWQEEQQKKPARRWDSIVEKIIWAVLAAVIATILATVGLK